MANNVKKNGTGLKLGMQSEQPIVFEMLEENMEPT
jgi:hypothetical protein